MINPEQVVYAVYGKQHAAALNAFPDGAGQLIILLHAGGFPGEQDGPFAVPAGQDQFIRQGCHICLLIQIVYMRQAVCGLEGIEGVPALPVFLAVIQSARMTPEGLLCCVDGVAFTAGVGFLIEIQFRGRGIHPSAARLAEAEGQGVGPGADDLEYKHGEENQKGKGDQGEQPAARDIITQSFCKEQDHEINRQDKNEDQADRVDQVGSQGNISIRFRQIERQGGAVRRYETAHCQGKACHDQHLYQQAAHPDFPAAGTEQEVFHQAVKRNFRQQYSRNQQRVSAPAGEEAQD